MSPDNINLARIKEVAKSLGDLLEKCVFVGGATVQFYMEDTNGLEIRPTDDVDCVVNVFGSVEYRDFEDSLRKLGFINDIEDGVICRYRLNEMIVDFMPPDESILGFTNEWYEEGLRNTTSEELGDGITIQVFSLPYFINSKISAYHGRKEKDFRLSKDIEDLLSVLDSRKNLEKDIELFPNKAHAYFTENLVEFLKDPLFREAISGVGFDAESRTRAITLFNSLNVMINKPI